jgi:hypothetical protein
MQLPSACIAPARVQCAVVRHSSGLRGKVLMVLKSRVLVCDLF